MSVKTDWGAIMKEIAPEFSIQGLLPKEKLYRYDLGNDRFYYRKNAQGSIPHLSVTSFCSKSLPTSQYLTKWIVDVGGIDAADFKKHAAAEYGTLLHIEIGNAIKKGEYDLGAITNLLVENVSVHYRFNLESWIWKMKQDMLSFFQFYSEKIEKVMGMEFPVYSSNFQLAGTVDFIGQVKFGRGTVNAIVDYKSGRNGLYDNHALQLECYKEMWNELYGDIFPVTHIFNWQPSNWKKKPTYKFTNQTNNDFSSTIKDRMKIALLEGWVIPPKQFQEITGKVELTSFNYENHLIGF